MAWRFVYMPYPDKHVELVREDLRKVFHDHPCAKVELLELLVELGVIE